MMREVILLVSVLCWQPCFSNDQLETCSADRSTHIKLSVNSYRNQTGHWVSQVQVQHDPNNRLNSARWNVELEQRTQDCNGNPSILIEATITSPPLRAGPGYELFPEVGYYKFHAAPRTWEEGQQICENEGAHLAIINSDQESGVLQTLFARHPKIPNATHEGVAGVGFHDRYIEGQYLTVFGKPLSSTGFERWSPLSAQQPDNAGASATHPGEDCGSIHRDGLLNDINCGTRMAFICEQEL